MCKLKHRMWVPVLFLLVLVMFVMGCGSVNDAYYDAANDHIVDADYDDASEDDVAMVDVDVSTDDHESLPEENSTSVVIIEPSPLITTILYKLETDAFIQSLDRGYESRGGGFLSGTIYLDAPGSPVYTIVDGIDGSHAIKVSERLQNFYALDIVFSALDLSYGGEYVFHVAGLAEAGITMQLGRTDAPWSAYTQTTVDADGMWALSHTLTNNQLLEYFISNQRGIRIMTADAPTANFIVNSILVYRVGERGADEPSIPEWDLGLPSLAESFSGHFRFGNIWSTASRMNAFNTEMGFLHHFNAVTAENNHKVDSIAPQRGIWNFATADAIVDWAEDNELAMIGHTLVWHSQSPTWLTTVPNTDNQPLTRAEAIENMHLYISTVASRYAGRIYSWDVVNEAIWGADATTWRANPDWREHMRSAGRGLNASNQSQWFDAFANGAEGDEHGSDYIFYAFRFARIYDPFAILYYNDYNDHVPGKRDAIAQMVVGINERWRQDPLYDGRLLIEGIGMQAHYSIRGWMTHPRYVRSAIELYITTGARISITEWDITVGGSRENPAVLTDALLTDQAERFGLLMDWYLEFSDYIARVSLWGLADHQSWISWGYPLIFDDRFQPKPAYFALLESLENADPPNISVPTVTTDMLPEGQAGILYGYQFRMTQSNHAPVTWHVASGDLPQGLRLVAATGALIGTPAETGTFEFVITASNTKGYASQPMVIIIR